VTATREGASFASGTATDPAMAPHGMTLTLRIWRQKSPADKGRMVTYQVEDISPDMSFLEMLDVLNEKLILAGDDPVVFDHDCREGICGSCGLMINGTAHGRGTSGGPTTTCQLHMRKFKDGDTIDIEPWRATAFPVIKDLSVDRSALDRIIQSGGYISAPTGTAPEAHSILVPKKDSDAAFDAATCIGCGACVAACPNASSMLFTAAKVSHLGLLPQGQPERNERVVNMVAQQDREGFGGCTNIGECSAACPKGISMENISRLNHDLLGALRAGARPKS
jgi:succinate dehydrogenase / fumarate reductase iron-sulfur subunit